MLPGRDQVLPGCDQMRPDVARWSKNGEKSVFEEGRVPRKVFWRSGSGKKSVFGTPSQDQRADTFDDSAPFSSDKIRAKILDLGYGGARRALHNLSQKSLL